MPEIFIIDFIETKKDCFVEKWKTHMIKVMKQRLVDRKRELERQREYFRIDIKMDSVTYEDNVISSLLEIKNRSC